MKLYSALLAWLAFAYSSAAFQVVESWQNDPEGGKIETLIIITDGHRFTLISPYNYTLNVDSTKKELQFSSTNKTRIIIQITGEFPEGLPNETVLKNNVLNRYFGAAILRSAPCPAGAKTGWLVDVKRVFTPEISLITRHAFVPWTHGTVQFTLSSDSVDFEQHRHLFGNLLNSFRIEPFAQ
jgi:hypothetical protein